MTAHDTIVVGADRVRISPWRGSSSVASIVPFAGAIQVQVDAVARALDAVRDQGFDQVVTSALGPAEIAPFLSQGFTTHHELHLLSKDLEPVTAPSWRKTRNARRTDWGAVLDIDRRAFAAFWQFDESGIRDALAATPTRRFRVVRHEPVLGYHITGRAGLNGYLQRLAVHPDAHGQGWGSLLLSDALAWMFRRGARRGYVNTQLENQTALALYLRHGFLVEDQRLAVLQRDI